MQPARLPRSQSTHQALNAEDPVHMNLSILVPIGILVGVGGIIAAPTIAGLLDLWAGRDDYSHGYLVPLISGYMVWSRRAELFEVPLEPARWIGTMVLGLSGLVLLLAQLGGLITPGGAGMIGMVLGMVLLLTGVEWTKRLLAPIAYLVFCVPILDFVIAPLQWPFQLLTAEMSTKALQGLGVPAFLEGNSIAIPGVTMEVATQCSGASLLIAVTALAIPLAYLNLRLWWTRVGLLMLGIAVAIVANWARVTVIGLYAHMGGKELHGPMHIFQGLSVAWVGLVGIFIGAWIFGRIEQRRSIVMSTVITNPAWKAYRFSESQRLRVQQAGWIGVVVVVALAGMMYGLTPIPTSLRQEFSSFPGEIGSWRGEQVGGDGAFMRVQGADVELVREYVAVAGGRKVQLYVAYVERQGQGKEIVNDQTSQLHQHLSRVSIVDNGAEVANVGIVNFRRESREVLFWYDDNGQMNTDRRRAKLSMLLNGLFHRRTNGALVVISTPVRSETGGKEVRAELVQFAKVAYPILQSYLP